MNARSFKRRSVCHHRLILVTCIQKETTTVRDLFSFDAQCEILEIIMAEKVWVCIHGA